MANSLQLILSLTLGKENWKILLWHPLHRRCFETLQWKPVGCLSQRCNLCQIYIYWVLLTENIMYHQMKKNIMWLTIYAKVFYLIYLIYSLPNIFSIYIFQNKLLKMKEIKLIQVEIFEHSVLIPWSKKLKK